ncbi:MAG: hypothetical protein L6Q71_02325 [Planctomycetes bacterium]|nr:hypothetical protein [Planctomycetota bacterium]NUQ34003.1 hypothetical protein [Planctomycetaceae bacterium]
MNTQNQTEKQTYKKSDFGLKVKPSGNRWEWILSNYKDASLTFSGNAATSAEAQAQGEAKLRELCQ